MKAVILFLLLITPFQSYANTYTYATSPCKVYQAQWTSAGGTWNDTSVWDYITLGSTGWFTYSSKSSTGPVPYRQVQLASFYWNGSAWVNAGGTVQKTIDTRLLQTMVPNPVIVSNYTALPTSTCDECNQIKSLLETQCNGAALTDYTSWNQTTCTGGQCKEDCPSPSYWDSLHAKCVTPCPSGEFKAWDPERCVCDTGSVRLADGKCGPPPNCQDWLEAESAKCKYGVKDAKCDIQTTINEQGEEVLSYNENEVVCNPPPTCDGGLVYDEVLETCVPPECAQGSTWSESLGRCLPDIKEPPEEGKKCADGSDMPENGNCPDGTPTPQKCPDGSDRIDGKCPDDETSDDCAPGQILNDLGKCVWPKPTKDDDDPDIETTPGEKTGQDSFFPSGSVSIKVPIKSWGVKAPGTYDLEPFLKAVEKLKESSLIKGMRQIKGYYASLIQESNPPAFSIPIGLYSMDIDLSVFDSMATAIRNFMKIMIFISFGFLILRQWKVI